MISALPENFQKCLKLEGLQSRPTPSPYGLVGNDEKVAYWKKYLTQFKTRAQKPYPI